MGLTPSRRRRSLVCPSSDRKTVLVVEDDAGLRDVMRVILEDTGYRFEGAEHGLAALEKIHTRRPDLVILDLYLPRMRGVEFLHNLRAGADTRDVPVIVMTGASRSLCPADLGVAACLEKPFHLDDLLWHVNDLVAMPRQVPLAAQEPGQRDRGATA